MIKGVIKKPVIIVLIIFILALGFYTVRPKSEYIDIKYREDSVEITTERWESIDTSRSSFIREAHYDKKEEYMIINLKGTNYHYCGLPVYIWVAFKEASSLGSYYNKNIRGNYDCRINSVPDY